MDSESFAKKFESGKLGDNVEFFEWFGFYELYFDIANKINQPEAINGSETNVLPSQQMTLEKFLELLKTNMT